MTHRLRTIEERRRTTFQLWPDLQLQSCVLIAASTIASEASSFALCLSPKNQFGIKTANAKRGTFRVTPTMTIVLMVDTNAVILVVNFFSDNIDGHLTFVNSLTYGTALRDVKNCCNISKILCSLFSCRNWQVHQQIFG